MSLVLFADGVEVVQAIGEDIEDTQDTAHIEGAVAGEPSPAILYITSDIIWSEEGAVGIELQQKFCFPLNLVMMAGYH